MVFIGTGHRSVYLFKKETHTKDKTRMRPKDVDNEPKTIYLQTTN